MVRTFVAVELPVEVRDEVGRTQREMQHLARMRYLPLGNSLKWVAPESIHLTLKFLGDVPEDALAGIGRALLSVVVGRSAVRLALAERGAFPNARSPRVLWIGLTGDLTALADLQHRVEQELGLLGFAPDNHGFSPHLTLARVREQASPSERRAVAELLAQAPASQALAFASAHVSLIKSELRPTGALYQTLTTAVLQSVLQPTADSPEALCP